VISGTYGGTGVNNGASTITIGGNVTFSGAFATTLTVTAGTSVTLPTSGTLVNTGVTTLSSLASVGTVTTGTWSAGLKDYTETVTSASTGAAYTVNMANGNWFKLTLTANCTLSLSNVPATGGQGCSLTLALIQDATGSRTVTWPASFDWGTAGAPTLTTTANKVDLVTAISDDNGTTFRALLAGKGFGA
jgi:hypothetical protein